MNHHLLTILLVSDIQSFFQLLTIKQQIIIFYSIKCNIYSFNYFLI